MSNPAAPMTDDPESIWGAEGPLSRALAGYRPRAAQKAMADAVARTLADGGVLLVEAGTGVGKTYAYLVPALQSGRQVAISTGTRTLQDQLFNRDLPRVSSALGRPVKVALLKGRANYLCLHRMELAGRDKPGPGRLAGELASIRRWSHITRSGEISEVTDVPETSAVWPKVTSTRENCLGQDCEVFDACHVVKARRRAQAADIVVVNHHLLLADLALREGGFGELLPDAEAIIIDEAHQLPEIAQRFFGVRLGSRAVDELARDLMLESAGSPIKRPIWQAAEQMQKTVSALRLSLGPDTGRRRLEDNGAGVGEAMAALDQALGDAETLLAAEAAGESRGLESCRQRLGRCRNLLASLIPDAESEGLRWAEMGKQGFSLNLTPFDVAGQLGEIIASRAASWVFTSATLAVGDDFTHFAGRVGAEEPACLKLDSPFDFARQSMLYLPDRMPDPGSGDYTRRVIEEALPLIRASRGRAFVLFTSHRSLREASAMLREEPEFSLLVQGDAPREVLLNRFRREGNAVLLGSSSFWEGVDVRGPALSLVVIDKLPFASPGDPVLQARLEAIRREGGNPFTDYQLPQAVLALKQGVGRLIRDHEDGGVAMLCDPRLRTRGYGRLFLRSLPPMTRAQTREDAVQFLTEHVAPHALDEAG